MIKQAPLRVNITRGPRVESFHEVDAIVLDAQGLRLESFGEHNVPVFPRSAIKKIQAIALVETGAYQKFGLDRRHLALACGSHWAEPEQIEIVHDWLARLQLTTDHLECGPHWPGSESATHALVRAGEMPTSAHNNCSGKHCAMMTLALHLGAPVQGYSKWDHPVQQYVRKIFADFAKYDLEEAPWGIDGCGIPTYSVALKDIAFAMSAFLAGRLMSQARWDGALEVLAAVREHPHLIAGREAPDSKVLQLSDGDVIIKTGAEGVYTVLATDKGLAMAVKSRDGVTRAAKAAVCFLLERYKVFDWPSKMDRKDQLYRELRAILCPEVKNWSGTVTGEIQMDELEF